MRHMHLLLNLCVPLPPSPCSHPSDEKEHSHNPFPRNISAASLGSLLPHHHSSNHIHLPEPSVTEPLMGSASSAEQETRVDVEKNDVQVPTAPG